MSSDLEVLEKSKDAYLNKYLSNVEGFDRLIQKSLQRYLKFYLADNKIKIDLVELKEKARSIFLSNLKNFINCPYSLKASRTLLTLNKIKDNIINENWTYGKGSLLVTDKHNNLIGISHKNNKEDGTPGRLVTEDINKLYESHIAYEQLNSSNTQYSYEGLYYHLVRYYVEKGSFDGFSLDILEESRIHRLNQAKKRISNYLERLNQTSFYRSINNDMQELKHKDQVLVKFCRSYLKKVNISDSMSGAKIGSIFLSRFRNIVSSDNTSDDPIKNMIYASSFSKLINKKISISDAISYVKYIILVNNSHLINQECADKVFLIKNELNDNIKITQEMWIDSMKSNVFLKQVELRSIEMRFRRGINRYFSKNKNKFITSMLFCSLLGNHNYMSIYKKLCKLSSSKNTAIFLMNLFNPLLYLREKGEIIYISSVSVHDLLDNTLSIMSNIMDNIKPSKNGINQSFNRFISLVSPCLNGVSHVNLLKNLRKIEFYVTKHKSILDIKANSLKEYVIKIEMINQKNLIDKFERLCDKKDLYLNIQKHKEIIIHNGFMAESISLFEKVISNNYNKAPIDKETNNILKEHEICIVNHQNPFHAIGPGAHGVCITIDSKHHAEHMDNNFCSIVIVKDGYLLLWGLLVRCQYLNNKKHFWILNNLQGSIGRKVNKNDKYIVARGILETLNKLEDPVYTYGAGFDAIQLIDKETKRKVLPKFKVLKNTRLDFSERMSFALVSDCLSRYKA